MSNHKREEHELKTPLASFLEFEFRPSALFKKRIGLDVRFEVANSLDLLLQEQGLMGDALAVQASRPDGVTSVIWFRYSSSDLHETGISTCTLFADSSNSVFGGVCGTLFDRKQI